MDSRILVNNRLTPFQYSRNEGKLCQVLSVLSFAHNSDEKYVRAMRRSDYQYWTYSFEDKLWHKLPREELSEMDKIVLAYSHMGYTVEQIADKICRSSDTVKGYKKSIFSKLHVDNIVEAVAAATARRMV